MRSANPSMWMSEACWRMASIRMLFTRLITGASLASLSRSSFSSGAAPGLGLTWDSRSPR